MLPQGTKLRSAGTAFRAARPAKFRAAKPREIKPLTALPGAPVDRDNHNDSITGDG